MGIAKIGPAQGEQRQKTTAPINVTIAMFFDGTSNNKNNTDERNIYTKLTSKQAVGNALTSYEQSTLAKNVYKEKTADLSSYENDYSNIARLWKNYSDSPPPNQYKIYIEGIGTADLVADDSSGCGWGGGEDGITAKVKKGCELIAKKLRDVIKANPNAIIKSLTIDVFGFSRGAAAARNFVYEATNSPYKEGCYLKLCFINYNVPENISPNIRFVGLFDTVASYADGLFTPKSLDNTTKATDETPGQFKNDVTQLHLDTIAYKAKCVVQFSADDEHRGNFPLTTIDMAVSAKKGFPFSLPGVHSDIGGSYTDKISEKNIILLNRPENELLKEKERLISEGWFHENELKLNLTNLGHGHLLNSGNLCSERIVSNKYSFIPLHFMCKLAVAFTEKYGNSLPLDQEGKNIENQYSIIAETLLIRIKNRLETYVFENGPPLIFKNFSEVLKTHHQSFNDKTYSKQCNDEIGDQEDLRLLRHSYLHWNANYNESRVIGVGTIHPFYPRLVNGLRQRFENHDKQL